jgi:3-hydroxyisobutyrate dehydrogenase
VSSNALTVAVLGAGGTMGRPMAANIAAAGHAVRAWNRTRERAEPLAEQGVELFDSPAEAADGAGVVVTILSDAGAVADTVRDALPGVGDGAIWAQMSTIGIEGTEACDALARRHGLVLVDAPVLGTKAPAEQGKLTVLASGPDRARDHVDPVFDAVGAKTIWLGDAGAGTRLKLVINAWLVSLVEGAAEAIALAEAIDVDPNDFLEAVADGPVDLPYLQTKGRMMIERDFEPSFKLALAAKDAGLVLEAAERHGADLPMLEAIAERLREGAAEHGDEDMAATFRTSAKRTARSSP